MKFKLQTISVPYCTDYTYLTAITLKTMVVNIIFLWIRGFMVNYYLNNTMLENMTLAHNSNPRGYRLLARVCAVNSSSIQCPLPRVGPILANTRRWANAGLMLPHRLWRWTNINPALVLCLVLAGMERKNIVLSNSVGAREMTRT